MTQDDFKRLLALIAQPDMFPQTEWATGVNSRGEPLRTVRELYRRIKPLEYAQAEAALIDLRLGHKSKAITIGHINDAVAGALAQHYRMQRKERELSETPAPESDTLTQDRAEDQTLRQACAELTEDEIAEARRMLIDRAQSEFERRYFNQLDINKPGAGARRFRRFALRVARKATA